MKSKDVYGVIEFWNGTSYGFIKPDRGGDDVFFRVSELPEGQQVSDSLVPANAPEYFAVTPGQVLIHHHIDFERLSLAYGDELTPRTGRPGDDWPQLALHSAFSRRRGGRRSPGPNSGDQFQ